VRGALRHSLLTACGVEHGFGTRTSGEPAELLRPRQVHGAATVTAAQCEAAAMPEADAVISARAAQRIGVMTADCVPILVANTGGSAVAAIHAGWRGLAAGVIESGVRSLREAAGPAEPLVAVIGPHIGPCCYEVDEPVLGPLRVRFGAELESATRPSLPGRALLDLGALTQRALCDAGVEPGSLGAIRDACTRCDAERFHSYRRDGSRSGRLFHFIAACPEA